jgi:two-component system, cell cycle response regulator
MWVNVSKKRRLYGSDGMSYAGCPNPLPRKPFDPNDASDSDHVRAKTVVTSISRISERPAGKEACLVVIYGSELGKKYNLNSSSLVVGRSSKCDIQIDQESISRNHSKIVNTGKSILIRDLGSTNGTYVNDEPIDEYILRDGDLIKIGRTIFKFLTGGNIENAYHEEIYRLTTVDGLTQISNKRYFMETIEREIARAQRYRRALSLVMFDLDHFKNINDTYGHLAGDDVLKQLASAVKQKIRREDLFARYGGEEFAIVLPEIDRDHALTFAEKVRQLVQLQEFRFENTRIDVTISMGVASVGDTSPDMESLIKRAAEHLYAAKNAGRNQVRG